MLGCLTTLPTAVEAQPKAINFRHLGTEQGLSQGSVHALLQDRRGFMWLATQDGLNRWDGQRFVTYKHDPADADSLAAPHVWSLAEDAAGRLWIGTDGGGLDRLDGESMLAGRLADGVFTHHRHDPDDSESLASDRVRALVVDRRGVLWVGTDAGLQRYLGAGRFETLTTADPRILTLSEEADGTVWAGTRGGAERFDADGRRLEALEGVGTTAAARQVRAILRDRGGYLWVGTYEGLGRVDPSDGAMTVFHHQPDDPFSLPDDRVRSLLEDTDGRLWIGTDGGLAVYRPADASFHVYRHDSSWAGSLALDSVLGLYQDRGGLLWAATQGRGVDRWHPDSWSLGPYRGRDEPGSLAGDAIMAFAEDHRGDVWIGTLGDGLQRWNRTAGHFETLRHDPNDPTSLADDRVMALLHDGAGMLWVGTFGAGLDRIEIETGRLEHFRHEPDDPLSLPANGIATLHEDSAGTIWIGTFGGGLARFDRSRGAFRTLRSDPQDPRSLPNDRVSALAEGADALWVGTTGGGLARMDRASETFQVFRHDRETPGSLSADDVLALRFDSENRLWIGTKGGGLDLLESFDPATGEARFRTFSERDGLPSGTIYGIRTDDAGQLWMSTTNGLAVLDPSTLAIRTYHTRHGLLSNELNFGAHYRSRRGELFFGGVQGFNVFFPSEVEINDHLPPVVLTALETRSEGGLGDVPRRGEALVLDHVAAASFSFEFAALDFNAPEEQRYAYRLDGFDKDWIELEDQRRITYTNMSPGRYVFRVKASNGDAVWNETGAAVPLHVKPAPWQTWWAWVAYALILAGAGYFGARWRHRGLARRSEELEKIVSERTAELEATVDRVVASESEARDARRRALRALAEALEERRRAQEADRTKSTFLSSMSHELRTPLNAMLGFSQLLDSDPDLSESQREGLAVIQRSGEHLLGLIEDILSLSKIEAGKLTLDIGTFDPRRVLASVEEMLRARADAKGLELRVDVDPGLPAAVRGDEGRLAQVLLNLVGNAVKFTERGIVSVRLQWRDGQAVFEVTDTGPGIAVDELDLLFRPFEQTRSGRAAAEGTGLGLSISRELVHLMGGSMEVESREGEGASFRFTVPLDAADAIDEAPRIRRRLALGTDELLVLVADDSEANRMLVRRQMEALGATVVVAQHGAEAVELWQHHRPRLVWMDLRMPRLSGEAATRQIRELETAEHEAGTEHSARTVIIALTANAFADDAVRLRDAGIDDVVLKPCRTDQLIDTMARWLGLRLDGDGAAAPRSTTTSGLPPDDEPPSGDRDPGRDATEPRRDEVEARGPAPTGPTRQPAGSPILVVDDDPVLRVLATKCLERAGHQVITANDGAEALERAAQSACSVILMDVKMQGLGGLEATRQLRARGDQTPIIGLTGLASADEHASCRAAGMDAILTKPFRLEALTAEVDHWLRRAPTNRRPGALQVALADAAAENRTREGDSGTGPRDDGERAPGDQVTWPADAVIAAGAGNVTGPDDGFVADASPLDHDWLRLLERVDSDASDPVLAHVVDLFLETAPHRVDELRRALATDDSTHLLRLARRLRDSSAMLGAEGVVDACSELETLTRRGAAKTRVERSIKALRGELERASVALASEREDGRQLADTPRAPTL
ncbi:MAG: two-component regulator propeller domain-containing protein [Acidobacteriota bacterium]